MNMDLTLNAQAVHSWLKYMRNEFIIIISKVGIIADNILQMIIWLPWYLDLLILKILKAKLASQN